jgi:hypothetical protein
MRPREMSPRERVAEWRVDCTRGCPCNAIARSSHSTRKPFAAWPTRSCRVSPAAFRCRWAATRTSIAARRASPAPRATSTVCSPQAAKLADRKAARTRRRMPGALFGGCGVTPAVRQPCPSIPTRTTAPTVRWCSVGAGSCWATTRRPVMPCTTSSSRSSAAPMRSTIKRRRRCCSGSPPTCASTGSGAGGADPRTVIRSCWCRSPSAPTRRRGRRRARRSMRCSGTSPTTPR